MLTHVYAGLSLQAQMKYYSDYILYWIAKDTVISLGQICACVLALYQISKGAPIGNFVMLITYWGNFTGNPFAVIAVATSRCLMFYRQTYQCR